MLGKLSLNVIEIIGEGIGKLKELCYRLRGEYATEKLKKKSEDMPLKKLWGYVS